MARVQASDKDRLGARRRFMPDIEIVTSGFSLFFYLFPPFFYEVSVPVRRQDTFRDEVDI